jgi:hypothetical protein
MRAFGLVSFVVVLLFVLLFLAVLLRSLPDIARYRRLRRM